MTRASKDVIGRTLQTQDLTVAARNIVDRVRIHSLSAGFKGKHTQVGYQVARLMGIQIAETLNEPIAATIAADFASARRHGDAVG